VACGGHGEDRSHPDRMIRGLRRPRPPTPRVERGSAVRGFVTGQDVGRHPAAVGDLEALIARPLTDRRGIGAAPATGTATPTSTTPADPAGRADVRAERVAQFGGILPGQVEL